jgi:hypothetical protein
MKSNLQRMFDHARSLDIYERLFFILTTIQAGVVWLHRSFPTQDGPFQIYLANVLGDLIRGTGIYSSYYQAQGYVHPYSFTVYALMLLNQVFHPLIAEKILVSVYFVVFALGARFLVRSIHAENHWLPLFMLPFAFNTYLCLGIYNFSFGIALMMFLAGVWLRWSGQWSIVRSLLWLSLLMLLALMHHVPLLILGGFAGIHLIARAVQFLRSGSPAPAGIFAAWQKLRGDAGNALLLAAPLGWYGSFALASARSVAPTIAAVQVSWLDRIKALMEMLPISPYLVSGYCFCLVVLVVAPSALLLLRPSGVSFALNPAAACLALSASAAVCLAVYVFGPHFLFGHSHGYFAERMALPFVIFVLAALAPLQLPPNLGRIAAIFVTALLLHMTAVRERETARMVADLTPLYDAQPTPPGSSGAIIAGTEGLEGLTFNPYYWAGALYAQQGQAVLLNASWTYEPISLVATRHAHPWDDTTSPDHFRQVLQKSGVPQSPPISFLCGGKWDASSKRAGSALAQQSGLVPVFDSSVYYCYGGDPVRVTASR